MCFWRGTKLRLEVSSSNFPRFDRNFEHWGRAGARDADGQATNVIYHDKAHPSALILPIVP